MGAVTQLQFDFPLLSRCAHSSSSPSLLLGVKPSCSLVQWLLQPMRQDHELGAIRTMVGFQGRLARTSATCSSNRTPAPATATLDTMEWTGSMPCNVAITSMATWPNL